MKINVYEPLFTESDAKIAYDVVKSGMLSQIGKYVRMVEERFENLLGVKHAAMCSSGTTALHLAMLCFDLPERPNIAVPASSFAATAFAVKYVNATPVFIDADQYSWNMDLDILESKCKSGNIHAVVAVHNYGNPLNMDRLRDMAEKYGFYILEDACEALMAKYDHKMIGSFGDIGVFSFYGNKVITGGEGGLIVTNNTDYYNKIMLLKGQAQDPNRRFIHLDIGYNYRYTNIQASLIYNQLDRINQILEIKKNIFDTYNYNLNDNLKKQGIDPLAEPSLWMYSVKHGDSGWYKLASEFLSSNGVETRPIFPPMPSMPAFIEYDSVPTPVGDNLYDTGITLPSGPGTGLKDIERVCNLVNSIC